MMQNNPMGAMMPQGVAPAAYRLKFQSDPSMRAQFKGFMSGMQAKQPAPAAPMAPMMQQPLPMPPSMQNIDIFSAFHADADGKWEVLCLVIRKLRANLTCYRTLRQVKRVFCVLWVVLVVQGQAVFRHFSLILRGRHHWWR